MPRGVDTWVGPSLVEREVVDVPGWNGSNRRDRLPSNWPALRKRRLEFDQYECRWENAYGETTCTETAVDVDHKIPGDDHSFENLQSLCDYHHDQKSAAEGARAAAARRRTIDQRFRRTEGHPGLL